MYRKKLLSLALAALLPCGLAVAEEQTASEAEPAADNAAVEESTADAAAQEPMAPVVSAPPSREGHMKERAERYEALRKRAEESGVLLPEKPPWERSGMMAADDEQMKKRMEHIQKMQAMTPEERETFRMERYQEMRAKAAEIGMELPETPPWKDRQNEMMERRAKHMEVMKSMTEEQRKACHAMHAGPNAQGMGMPPRAAMPPVYGGPRPGYGYGPGPYGPGPNFWNPEQ